MVTHRASTRWHTHKQHSQSWKDKIQVNVMWFVCIMDQSMDMWSISSHVIICHVTIWCPKFFDTSVMYNIHSYTPMTLTMTLVARGVGAAGGQGAGTTTPTGYANGCNKFLVPTCLPQLSLYTDYGGRAQICPLKNLLPPNFPPPHHPFLKLKI